MNGFLGLLLFAISSGPVCSASSPTLDFFRQQVIKANTASALKEAIRQEVLFMENLQTCEFELKSRVPPVHCYAVLKVQRAIGTSNNFLNLSKSNLNSLCLLYTQKKLGIHTLKSKLRQVQGQSLECEQALDEKVADMEYQSPMALQRNSEVYRDIGPVH